jgi:hypothetical protein
VWCGGQITELASRSISYDIAGNIMQLISSRSYPFLDAETLEERKARDTLLKVGENHFLLHMTAEAAIEERLVRLDCRAALLWINQEEREYGMDWE